MDIKESEKLIQKFLPNFKVTGELGKGSFGAVYRIKDDLKERAAKIVPLTAMPTVENGTVVSADSKLERDFRHIVESYERIACEEIVTVYDFYMDKEKKGSGNALVIMEIYPTSLDGYVLSNYEKTGAPLVLMVAEKVIEKVAIMIGNLYTKTGFLFEDFKPDNILIKEHLGDLKLVVGDIGGLKNVVSIGLTGSQVTPTYCAPEVLRKGQVPDMRSIMYSFGLLAFYILEGHLPYESERFAARLDLVKDKGMPYSRTDVPERLKQVITRCVAFEANDRFLSFEDIAKALRGEIPALAPDTSLDKDFGGGTISVGATAPAAAPDSSDFESNTITVGGTPPPAATAAPQGQTAQPATPNGRPESTGSLAARRSPALRKIKKISTSKVSSTGVSITDEKDLIATIEKEIKGLRVKKGETLKINNQNAKVVGNIFVESNAVLSITNSKLFFAENTGIISLGAIRARESLFSAIDSAKKWNNITIYSTPRSGISMFDSCRFHFARGIIGKFLKDTFNITRPAIHDKGFYGGALFIAGGSEKTLKIKQNTFVKCTAYEGGGIYFHKSQALVESCLFDKCSATGSGGGLAAFESNQDLLHCSFNNCSSGKNGGGAHLMSSNTNMDDNSFRGCMSKYYGGGLACFASSPILKKCRFDLCRAMKTGGGLFADPKSKPQLSFPSFSKCKPDDANIKT
jgi:serine/threonine protein kinase